MTAITSLDHACILLERDGRRLLLDPGSYTDPSALDRADDVLVTHEHHDHVDVGALAAAAGSRRDLRVWAPSVVVEQLTEAGFPADRATAVAAGDSFEAAGFAVQAAGGEHAVVHPDIPVAVNVAYVVDGALLHPGDSFALPPEGTSIDVVLVPVAGPWMKLSEAVDYLRAVRPRMAVPIHDGMLNEAGKKMSDRLVGELSGVSTYQRIRPGETIDHDSKG